MADPTLNFPFLHDAASKELITKSKVLFVMRGLSGSGKSTIARAITTIYPHSVVCSANDYFVDRNGVFRFNGKLLDAAHQDCQSKAKDACHHGKPVVIIDNTNVCQWEMKYYLKLANQKAYVVVLVEPKTPWKWDPVELEERSKHGVGVRSLMRKVGEFEVVDPVYYAWFLNEADSSKLSWTSQSLLKECLKHFPDLSKTLFRQLYREPPVDKEMQWEILQKYYTAGNSDSCLVHCTAKFCGGGHITRANAYHAKPCVQNSLGKAFTLVITSICFSPHSVAARVKLNEEQLQLFDKPEERGSGQDRPSTARYSGGISAGSSAASLGQSSSMYYQRGSGGHSGRGRSSARSMPDSDMSYHMRGLRLGAEEDCSLVQTSPQATGRSAHITLGCAQGIKAYNTNFDVLQLCDMEAGQAPTDSDSVKVAGGRARYFGHGICCVYFNTQCCMDSLFSGFYSTD